MKIRSLKTYITLLKGSYNLFIGKNLFSQAAALSYYTIFALPPMLVVIITSSTLLFSKANIRDFIFNNLSELLGDGSALAIFSALENSGVFRGSIWNNILGGTILIFTSTTVLVTIQTILNDIFNTSEREKEKWYRFLLDRIFSFSLLLGMGFILIVSLVINAFVASFQNILIEYIPGIIVFIGSFLNFVLPLVIIGILLAAIFQYMPKKRIPWKVALEGGIVTTILLSVGKIGISLYIGKTNTGNLYAAAGDVLVIMVWIFYASCIFLFGACYTANLLKRQKETAQNKMLAGTKH